MESYAPFKMKAKDYGGSPMLMNFPDSFPGGVGSSPAKGWLKNALKGAAKIFKKKGGKPPEETAAENVAEVNATTSGVQPHTHDETGGIVADAGGAQPVAEEPWQVMGKKEFRGMGRGARKEYMAGLSKDQRMQQIKQDPMAMFKGGGFGGGGSGGIFNMLSDIRLKENIKKTDISPSGIPIYEFNYIGDTNRYSGAMAQDLLKTNPDAVSMDTSGYYTVNYNNIDVDMHLLN